MLVCLPNEIHVSCSPRHESNVFENLNLFEWNASSVEVVFISNKNLNIVTVCVVSNGLAMHYAEALNSNIVNFFIIIAYRISNIQSIKCTLKSPLHLNVRLVVFPSLFRIVFFLWHRTECPTCDLLENLSPFSLQSLTRSYNDVLYKKDYDERDFIYLQNSGR